MEYLRAYKYVFDNAKWWQNLLLGVVCMLIPIVGPIVFMGYLCEVMESLLGDENAPYPDFDFGRFGEYLKRGVWPFLVKLVLAFVVMPFMCVSMVGVLIGFGLMNESALLGSVVTCLGFLFSFALAVVMAIITVPMVIRAALGQNFGGAFSVTFIKDFVRLTFWDIVLAFLFMSVGGTVLVLAGMVLCFIGMYPAMILCLFAQFHFHYQLYRLYLSRGGTPIPLKTDAQ